MKTINNYLNGRESGKIVGQIINVIIAIAGGVFCLIGIWMQVNDKF